LKPDRSHKPHVFSIQELPCGCAEGLEMVDVRGHPEPRYTKVRYCEEHGGEKERQEAARKGEAEAARGRGIEGPAARGGETAGGSGA
jgi:hypothetical protein